MQEGVQVRVRTRLLTFENHCLEGGLTFDDPFQESGVAGAGAIGGGASGGVTSADMVVVGCAAAVTAVALGGAL